MKSHEQIIKEKAKKMPLDGHQRQVLREYLEKGDKENNGDYLASDAGMHPSDNPNYEED